MRARLIVTGVLATLLSCVGCSTVKSVEVVTEKQEWSVGEHDYCVYKNKLVCLSHSLTTRMFALSGETKIPVEEALAARSVPMMSQFESHMLDKDVSVSLYNTRFSGKPRDYSIWNCVKTGLGSPAVDCVLLKQPDKDALAAQEAKMEERRKLEAAKDSALQTLVTYKNPEMLERRCGPPVQTSTDISSKILLYKGPTKFVAFHFNTWKESPLSKPSLTLVSLSSEPLPKLDHNHMLLSTDQHWFGDPDRHFVQEILQELPCLAQKESK